MEVKSYASGKLAARWSHIGKRKVEGKKENNTCPRGAYVRPCVNRFLCGGELEGKKEGKRIKNSRERIFDTRLVLWSLRKKTEEKERRFGIRRTPILS